MLDLGDGVRRFISYLMESEEGKEKRKEILRKEKDHVVVNCVSEQEGCSRMLKGKMSPW